MKCECYKTRCWGEYLDVSWNKLEKVGKKCLMRKRIICTRQHVIRSNRWRWGTQRI